MENQINKIAVVGANGYIGGSLVNFFHKKGIRTLNFTSDQPLILNGKIDDSLDEVTSVVWCASRVNPISAEIRPDLVDLELSEWNYFLDTWKEHYGSQKSITFLSSGGCTYSGSSAPFHEESIAEGINRYGKLKVAMERELLDRNLPSLILRVANVYGPNQPHGRGQGVIAEWKNAIVNRKDIKVFGSLESYRDYIFIQDLSEGIFRSLDFVNVPQILNLGGGSPVNLRTILDIVKTIKHDITGIEYVEKRSSDRDGYYLDISRFMGLANWQPNFSIHEGIRETIVI